MKRISAEAMLRRRFGVFIVLLLKSGILLPGQTALGAKPPRVRVNLPLDHPYPGFAFSPSAVLAFTAASGSNRR